MGRALLGCLIFLLSTQVEASMWANAARQGMQAFIDPGIMNGLNQLMQGQLTELKHIKGQGNDQLGSLRQLQSLLGNPNQAFPDQWRHWAALGQQGLPQMSLLQGMNANQMAQQYPSIKQVNQNFFIDKGSLQNFSQVERVKDHRQTALQQATVLSIAVAGKKKEEISEVQNRLKSLSDSAAQASSLHEDLRVTNQLLLVLAVQMQQQNAIAAQQLELNASIAAQSVPIGVR